MDTKKPGTEVNRREFLKTAAAATAAAAAVGIPRPGYVAEGGPLRVGLIGCGGRGTGAAEQALRAGEIVGVDVRLVALADVFEDQLQRAKRRFLNSKNKIVRAKTELKDDMCFAGLDAFKKLIATDVNYVILATPPGFRPEHFEAAVNAKKHVFTEKPVGTDPVGIRRFMAAAKKSEELGLSVVAGTQRRHQKPYVDTVKKIHDGAIGEIIAARAYWCGGPVFKARVRKPDWGDLEWQLRAWYSFCWICGDNIVEQHVHNIDIINWVMGTHPKSAFASGGRSWKTNEPYMGNIFDHFSVDYEYPNGVHMFSMSRHWNNASGGVFEQVWGTKGRSNCHDMSEGGGINPYVQEHVDLIKSITDKGPHLNEAMRVAESTMTAIMGRESAYSGRRLTWDDMMKSNLELVPKNYSWDMKLPVRPVPRPGAPNWRRGV